ncbi:MAG: UDP-N-acetylglucosamine 2-epimerase [Deltaproteobacteria bacterium]|jgi:GDP/UDP-N,N'-diacetylbacillosamine 2-epimerase (hydrolysing)|nr:UDP-N-acetylglucosamine 2-epimerase [Deltaproteobacteria bacterium]
MRKVLAVTGIRSEYDILSSVFKAIDDHPDLCLEICVTGAHLAASFGETVKQIRADGFTIADEVESLINGDRKSSRLRGAAIQLLGMIQCAERTQPDFLLVLGDREESLTTAALGAYMDIPTAHIGGGDKVIGNVDDQVRHAVTKLAHIHFPTSALSAERILKLGEEPFRIFNVGNPGLDRFRNTPSISREELFAWYGFAPTLMEQPLIMVIQHVISSEAELGHEQMKATMEALKELAYPTVLSYPNSDAGSSGIIRAIEEYSSLPNLRTFRNVPRLEFVNTLRQASCLLGNSSLGVLEAPFLKLPTINVGNRQKGRLHGDNIIFIDHEPKVIVEAVKLCLFDENFKRQVAEGHNPFGDGHSSEKIAKVLAEIQIDQKLLFKELTYE